MDLGPEGCACSFNQLATPRILCRDGDGASHLHFWPAKPPLALKQLGQMALVEKRTKTYPWAPRRGAGCVDLYARCSAAVPINFDQRTAELAAAPMPAAPTLIRCIGSNAAGEPTGLASVFRDRGVPSTTVWDHSLNLHHV